MIASQVKQIVFCNSLDNDQKVAQIAALFDQTPTYPPKIDYVDYNITRNSIIKLRHLLPKAREIESVEVLGVRRFTSPGTATPIAEYRVVGTTKLTNANNNSDDVSKMYFTITHADEIADVEIWFGFNLRAIRAECSGLKTVLVGENQMCPFPEIRVRFHFAD